MRWILIFMVLVSLCWVLAACDSSGSDEGELPTIMVLPTNPPQAPTATPETTQETPEETEAPDSSQGLPFLPPQTPPLENQTSTGPELPFATTPNASGGGLPFALPTINQGTAQSASGLPFLTSPDETGVINSDEPVNLYECPETTCAVLTTLKKADTVQIVTEENDWVTVRYQELEGYILVEFVIPLSEALASGDPSLIPLDAQRSTSQLPPGITSDTLATQQARSNTNPGLPVGGSITPPPQSLPPGIFAVTPGGGFNIQDLLVTPTPTGN